MERRKIYDDEREKLLLKLLAHEDQLTNEEHFQLNELFGAHCYAAGILDDKIIAHARGSAALEQ